MPLPPAIRRARAGKRFDGPRTRSRPRVRTSVTAAVAVAAGLGGADVAPAPESTSAVGRPEVVAASSDAVAPVRGSRPTAPPQGTDSPQAGRAERGLAATAAATEPPTSRVEDTPSLPEPPPEVEPPSPPPSPPPPVIGDAAGVALRSVSADALAVGFHEAKGVALAIAPADGTLDGRTDPAAAGREAADEVAPVIMPSRGRSGAPTSAVDIALPEGAAVHAPVTGTVVEVADYSLYGRTPDVLVTIAPEGREDLLVEVFHVEDPQVEPGDQVEAGVTPLAARSRLLPFPSQVDRVTGAATPHVHIELATATVQP